MAWMPPVRETTRFDPNLADPYYLSAYRTELETVWGRTPFADEVPELAYFALLAAFYDQEPGDIEDRQRALYYWLRGPFDENDVDSYINIGYHQLPTGSLVPKVLDNVCTAYNERPIRTFSNDASVQQRMTKLYKDAKVDWYMSNEYRRKRHHNIVATRWLVDHRRRMVAHTLTADQFRIRWDRALPGRIEELWYPVAMENPAENQRFGIGRIVGGRGLVTIFRVWTESATYLRDYAGNQIGPLQPNPYGRIPFDLARMRDSRHQSFYGSGLYQLTDASVRSNAYEFLAAENVIFNGFGVWFAINMQWAERAAKLRAGTLIHRDQVLSAAEGEAAPDLRNIGPKDSYTAIEDLHKRKGEAAMRDEGMPDYMVREGGSVPPSGIAMFMANLQLMNQRKDDVVALAEHERDRVDLFALVAEVDLGERGLTGRLDDFDIDFPDQRSLLDPDREYILDRRALRDGVMRPSLFVRKWMGVDQPITEQAAVELMQKNLELVRSIFLALDIDASILDASSALLPTIMETPGVTPGVPPVRLAQSTDKFAEGKQDPDTVGLRQ